MDGPIRTDLFQLEARMQQCGDFRAQQVTHRRRYGERDAYRAPICNDGNRKPGRRIALAHVGPCGRLPGGGS